MLLDKGNHFLMFATKIKICILISLILKQYRTPTNSEYDSKY